MTESFETDTGGTPVFVESHRVDDTPKPVALLPMVVKSGTHQTYCFPQLLLGH